MASTLPEPERYALESQVRESFGRCAYTHKTHEKMAERHSARLWRVKWFQIILSALTTCGAAGVVFTKEQPLYAYSTLVMSLLSLLVTGYVKDLNPGELAQKHRETASDIWNVRESYLSLLADIRDPAIPLAKLRERRDDLQKMLYKIYRPAPHTDGKAYSEAQEALKDNEELTFSDEEIDNFLPTPLRRKS